MTFHEKQEKNRLVLQMVGESFAFNPLNSWVKPVYDVMEDHESLLDWSDVEVSK